MALEFTLCGPADIAPMQDRILRWRDRAGDPESRLPVAVGLGLLIEHPLLGECWLVERLGVAIGYAAVEFGPGRSEASIACVYLVEGQRGLGTAGTVRRFLRESLLARGLGARACAGEDEDRHWQLLRGAGPAWQRSAA